MPFGITYEEVKRMVGRWAKTTQNARAIIRKSGFRPGSVQESAGAGGREGPLLTIPPVRIVNQCPAPSYGVLLGPSPTQEQIGALNATVEAAEDGNLAALD